MKRFFIENFRNFSSTLKRFPISILMALAVGILMCVVVNDGPDSVKFAGFAVSALSGLFAFIFIEILNEKLDKKPPKVFGIVSYALGALVLFLLYNFMGRYWETDISKYYVYFFGFTLFFISLSLFIEKYNNSHNHELYVYRVIASLVISTFLSLIVFLGVALIIFALFTLFGLKDMPIHIYRAFILILGTLNCWIFLNNFPSEKTLENFGEPIMGKKILNNILIPVEVIFSLILFAYFFKIIFEGVMPLRIVCYLALVYGIIAGFIIFFSPERRKNSNKLIRFYLPITSLIFLGLMFFTMGHRINTFGFTENRYYVIVIGLYLSFFMIYNLVWNKRDNILSLMVLSLFILVTTIGPINSFNISVNSQVSRFGEIMKANKIDLQNPSEDLSGLNKNDRKNALSIVTFLKNRDELGRIKENTSIDIDKFEKDSLDEGVSVDFSINLYSPLESLDVSSYNEMTHFTINEPFGFSATVDDDNLVFSYDGEKLSYSLTDFEKMVDEANNDKPLMLEFNGKITVALVEFNLYEGVNSENYQINFFEGYIFK